MGQEPRVNFAFAVQLALCTSWSSLCSKYWALLCSRCATNVACNLEVAYGKPSIGHSFVLVNQGRNQLQGDYWSQRGGCW